MFLSSLNYFIIYHSQTDDTEMGFHWSVNSLTVTREWESVWEIESERKYESDEIVRGRTREPTDN